MKKSVLLFFLLLSLGVYAQNNGELTIDNCKVLYKNNIEIKTDAEILTKKLRLTGSFINIYTEKNQIIAEMKAMPINYEGAGFTFMNTSIYLSSSNISTTVVIDIYENYIEITGKNIALEQTGNYTGINAGVKNLEFYALKKCAFRPGFLKRDKPTIEYDLREKIGIK